MDQNERFIFFKKFNQEIETHVSGAFGVPLQPNVSIAVDKSIYPFIRMPAGHPEALTDAWANLYISFAIGVDAHINNKNLKKAPYYPSIYEGVSGVAFVEAAIKSNKKKKWVKL